MAQRTTMLLGERKTLAVGLRALLRLVEDVNDGDLADALAALGEACDVATGHTEGQAVRTEIQDALAKLAGEIADARFPTRPGFECPDGEDV